MKNEKDCIECQCTECKTRFKIWLDETNKNNDTAERAEKNLQKTCPVCKSLAENNDQ